MLLEQLREFCLSLPGTEEATPFGPDVLVFKVNNKLFLLTDFESSPLQFNVKCEPARAIELREEYPCVIPGYHMNKKHWNTVVIDGSVNKKLLQNWILHSYELVSKGNKKRKK